MYYAIAFYKGGHPITESMKKLQESKAVAWGTQSETATLDITSVGQPSVSIHLRPNTGFLEHDLQESLRQKRHYFHKEKIYILAVRPLLEILNDLQAQKVKKMWQRDYSGTIHNPGTQIESDLLFYEDQHDGLLNLIHDEGFIMHKALPRKIGQ